jgi:hypothetical protein
MKFKIKASDVITDNPIIDIEQDPAVPLKVKSLMIPVINKFKKLGYDFFLARITQKKESSGVLNNIFINLRSKSYVELAFWIDYNATKDIFINTYVYKNDVPTSSYTKFTKEELKILDIYDFNLTHNFVEEMSQDPIDWVDM